MTLGEAGFLRREYNPSEIYFFTLLDRRNWTFKNLIANPIKSYYYDPDLGQNNGEKYGQVWKPAEPLSIALEPGSEGGEESRKTDRK